MILVICVYLPDTLSRNRVTGQKNSIGSRHTSDGECRRAPLLTWGGIVRVRASDDANVIEP